LAVADFKKTDLSRCPGYPRRRRWACSSRCANKPSERHARDQRDIAVRPAFPSAYLHAGFGAHGLEFVMAQQLALTQFACCVQRFDCLKPTGATSMFSGQPKEKAQICLPISG